jgi:arylsulfatase A-like enzyme
MPMKSTVLLFSLAAALLQAPALPAQNTAKPNILIIILDDLNDSVEGFGGHPQARTPNIDRLAQRGVRFLNAANNAPLCSPSRPSMLTGLYPHTTGYFGNPGESIGADQSWKFAWQHEVFKKSVSWMQHFSANGYEVYGAGKIDHNFAERWEDWLDPETGRRNYGPLPSWGPFPFGGSGLKPDKSCAMNFDLAASHPSLPGVYKLSFFVPLSDVPTTPPNHKTGFKGYTGWYLYNHPYRYVSETNRDPMPDERLAEYAETFFAQRPASGDNRPFFLNIGINRPHAPLVAPQKYFDLFPLDEIQLAPRKEDDLDDCAEFLWKDFKNNRISNQSGFGMYAHTAEKGYMKRWTQAYLACVAFADDMVGRILTSLENSPYADNTLVIITSDNGYHMGEKNYKFKNSAWEEATRIPLVIAGPGVAKGADCTRPVSLIDLYPTFIDFCGLPGHPHPHLPLDGHSLVPLLKNPTEGKWDGPDVALTSLIARDQSNNKPIPEGVGKPEAQTYSVRSERYRYILCPDGSEELYDHLNDPQEWTNLAGNPEFSTVRKKLHAEAEQLTGQTLGIFYKPGSYQQRTPE